MYRGIWCLRSKDDIVVPTPEQADEIDRCAKDAEYFLRNYCYINTKDNGMQPFPLTPRQTRELPVLESEKMVKSDWYRQSGYTTLVLAFMLWKALFRENTLCLYMAPKKALAYGNFSILRQMYLALPLWMQKGVIAFTKRGIRLDNGSWLVARPASAGNARGVGWDYVFIDEFGWIKDKAMVELAATLIPCFECSCRKHLILSHSHRFGRQTPANLLFWANTRLPFHVSEFTWDQDERLDEKWAETMRLRIGEKRFRQFYCGVIERPVQATEQERFGRWTVWEEGKRPDMDACACGRYLCAIVPFGRKSGVPSGAPYTQVLSVDGNGVFQGLKSDGATVEKVIAWMPEPAIPGNALKRFGLS